MSVMSMNRRQNSIAIIAQAYTQDSQSQLEEITIGESGDAVFRLADPSAAGKYVFLKIAFNQVNNH